MYHLPGLALVLVRPLRSSLGYHGRCTYSPVLVSRAGTSFVQCFAWSAKRGQMCLVCPTPCPVRLGITGAEHTRPCWYLCWYLFQCGQMCLVCPTPCAVRLGITGAEYTRPCWYLCWYLFRTVLRLVSPGNLSLARARTRTGTPLAQFAWVSRALYILPVLVSRAGTSFVQCFAWSVRAIYHLPGLVLVLVPLVQCFARSARAMYLLARVHVCVVCESLHSVNCACIPCTVLHLVRTGHVPTCPCLVLVTLVQLDSTGIVPTCPCP